MNKIEEMLDAVEYGNLTIYVTENENGILNATKIEIDEADGTQQEYWEIESKDVMRQKYYKDDIAMRWELGID